MYRMVHSDACADFVDNPQLSAAQNLDHLKAVCTSAYLPVGDLDGRSSGPYTNLDFQDLFKQWNFLVAFKSDVPTKRVNCDFWCGLRSSLDVFTEMGQSLMDLTPFYTNNTIDIELANKIGEAAKGQTYSIVMDNLGVPSDMRSREAVLEKRLAADGGDRLKRLILNFEKANGTKTILFEIANEPNLFPYIPPKLYAQYYRLWVKEIFTAMHSINRTRNEADWLIPKFMLGGLFISDGLPQIVTSVLDAYIRTPIFEVGVSHMSAEAYQEKVAYYLAQFSELSNPGWEKYDATTDTSRNSSYIAIVMGFTSNISCSYPQPCIDYWHPRNFISYPNLHFYPYTAYGSAYSGMNQHLSNLDRIMDRLIQGSEYPKVMLTEVGNLNPYSSMAAASNIVAPMTEFLKSNTKVQKVFWFQAIGSDSKYDILNSVKDIKILSDFVPGFVSQNFNGLVPAQGLFEADGKTLTPIGCRYYESANYPINLGQNGKCTWRASTTAVNTLLLN